jgi:formamidopyrimidine-DNA glycosylase
VPELPEVERGRRLAEAIAVGRRIERVWCRDDPIVFDSVAPGRWRRALEGRRVEAARRWGKQLWLELDAPPHPLFHFGMAGALKTPAATPIQLKSGPREDETVWPPRFLKIRLRLDDGGELAMTDARRLGRALLRSDPEREPPIARLGFDPLLSMPPPGRFSELLRSRRGVVKSLLLDQSFAAGVGNWIADEVLYQAGIDPRRGASSLTDEEARRLRARLASIVKRAVGANADSSRYPRTWLFHRRWGRRDDATTVRGERIEHARIGGRTAAWVPAAQH